MMRDARPPRSVRVAAGVLAIAGLTASTVGALVARSQGPAEDEKIAVKVCVNCHDAGHITSTRRNRDQWQQVVDNMVAQGATMTDDEYLAVMRYLMATRGRVNANRDPTADLSAVLQITIEDAGRIVDFRKKNGLFKDFEDLLKVPSIDRLPIEARRDAVRFD